MVARVETGIPQPGTLEGRIDAKIWRSPHVIRTRNNRQIVFLSVPTEAIGLSQDASSLFAGMPQNPQEDAMVTLIKAPDHRVMRVSVSPKHLKKPIHTWRVDIRSGKDPRIEHRKGFLEPPDILPYDPSFDKSLEIVLDNSEFVEKTLDDYTEGFLLRTHGIWNKDQTRNGFNGLMMAVLHHRVINENGVAEPQRRKSGEPYIDHPWETVRELMDHGVIDPDIIAAAWIHDVPEDGEKLRQPRVDPKTGVATTSYKKWAADTEEILAAIVGSVAAKYAMLMTRPQPDGIETAAGGVPTKEEANKIYYANLVRYPQVIMIKMADRLHNARTLWAMPEANQRATVISTVRNYFPIFERARDVYPEAVDYFMFETEKALRPIAEGLGIDYDSL